MDLQAIVVRTHVSHYFDFPKNILYKFVTFLSFPNIQSLINYQLWVRPCLLVVITKISTTMLLNLKAIIVRHMSFANIAFRGIKAMILGGGAIV